jgi:non-homologous end joining protein Ku
VRLALKQQYICTKDGEVVERDQMVKGYEFTKGQYVVLSADELKALDAVATNTIDLKEFVPADRRSAACSRSRTTSAPTRAASAPTA